MIYSQNHQRRFQVIRQDLHTGLDKIHSNEKVVNGFYVTEVEKQLRELSKRKYALLVTSGSHAITISLQAHGLKHGDAVIVTNYSCPASLSSVMIGGYEPVFCEINEHGNMDPTQLPSLMNSKVKGLVATGLYGDMHEHEAIKKFCDVNGLVYINDAAQSQFALCNGVDSLECGDTVAISFADNKPIPTIGTYGAILTDNDDVYNMVRALRKNGKATHDEPYLMAGYSSHPEEDKALQIYVTLPHFRKWIKRRVEIGDMYDEAFKGKIEVRRKPNYSTWNGHKYSIFVDDKLWSHSKLNDMGVQTERHYLDNFASLDWTPNTNTKFPMTDRFVRQSLTIPNNPHMTDEDVNFVIDCVLSHK